MDKYKVRNSNIELLRILCIFFIILHHSFYHSNVSIDYLNINYIILYIVQIFGIVANNIFILITGYYMVNKKLNYKSLIKIIFEVFFYSYFFLILNLLIFKQTGNNIVLKSILPLTSNQQWFVTNYVLLYISIPFLNILINNINRKQLFKLIIFFMVCFSILPTISRLIQYFSKYNWFICLYLVGAYMNKYGSNQLLSKKNLLFVISSISLIALMLIKDILKFDFIILDINNFIIFIVSLSTFMLFINKKEFNNSIVNYIASSVLGIYLIHDNFILRSIIWKGVNIGKYLKSPYFWIYELGVILAIFCACLIIDKIRQRFIERPILTFIDNRIDKLEEKTNNKGENIAK